ncbi:MAG: site-specific tyrosine recombinase XerC [Deltaproteobacteria bacterium]|nr:site-specific tyrosine recombinase XerC [Deltaproteobacteria bacterium]
MSAKNNELQKLLLEHLEWMRAVNYSELSVDARRLFGVYFIDWCSERGVSRPGEVNRAVIEQYRRHWYRYRKKNGMPLSFRSQAGRLQAVKMFFKWLGRNNYILYNPAADLEMPRKEQRLPRHVLTASEAEQVLNQPDIEKPLGIRDRAILETFYSTGIRRFELLGLRVDDLDLERGMLKVTQGKGKKDRLLPIGERAVGWVHRYLEEVRPELTVEPDLGVLFLTSRGEAMKKNLTEKVDRYVKAAKIGKQGGCHLFRHTMATLMLEGGADTRYIQQMLGHASLESTQVYTRVSIRKLKEVHAGTHPSARPARKDET